MSPSGTAQRMWGLASELCLQGLSLAEKGRALVRVHHHCLSVGSSMWARQQSSALGYLSHSATQNCPPPTPPSPEMSNESAAQPLCRCRGGYLSLPDHCHWKYLLNWPGNTYR